MLNADRSVPDREGKYNLPTYAMGETVPKLIHQCFFGARTFTDELATNVASIKSLNPGWQHTIYDEEMMKKFILDHYGETILCYYNRIDPKYGAARTDLFRYLLLYKVGGIYLDIKSTVKRPFDDFITPQDRYLLGQWDDPHNVDRAGWGMHKELAHIANGEFQQWHIICAPGHPFLRAVILAVLSNIDRYLPWRDGTGAHGTFRLTGPVAYTLAINPLREKHPSRIIHSAESTLEYSILSQRSHATLFTSHYYRLTDSIVKLGPVLSQVARMRDFSRRVKGYLRRRARMVLG